LPSTQGYSKNSVGCYGNGEVVVFREFRTGIGCAAKRGFTIGAIEQTEQTTLLQEVAAFDIKPYALIFGNEVNGVRQQLVDLSDCVIEIPQFGTKHSFNVSVCAGIVLWEFCKKFID
jgi:tRNA G18 (ribose-2'-O)-methylase SpoU